jgi:hypothetical protein
VRLDRPYPEATGDEAVTIAAAKAVEAAYPPPHPTPGD